MFDKKGKCPICRQNFQECKHSWGEVHAALTLKNTLKNVNMMKRRRN